MKVLFIAPTPPPYGGIANWVLLMKKRMQSNSDSDLIGIINTSPGKRGVDGRTLWNRIVNSGIDMLRINKLLKEQCEKERPDIIHLTTSGSLSVIRDILLMKTAKKLKIPIVYHIHFGRIPQIAKNNTREWKIIKKAIDISNATIAIDSCTYETLIKHFDKNKVTYIPNPFDTAEMSTDKTEETDKEVMFLGWCLKAKGIEELLTAWETVSEKHTEWFLRIVGPYKEDYKKELESKYVMEKVVFMGEKSHKEAMEFLSRAGVFTLPSYTEGFPNVILEAMAYGKPIVATSVGAIPEMLSDNCGITVPPQNSNELAKALDKMISDSELCKNCGENAKNKLYKQYKMDVVFEKYRDIWINALH